MREKNKHILAEAIQKLPTYSVPEGIWGGIEQGLMVEEQNDLIEENIPFLPEYNPPESIWDSIETSLAEAPPATKVVRLRWQKVVAYAAVLGGLSFAFFWLSTGGDEMSVSIAYSEEIIEESSLDNDWNTDEEDFEMVLAALDESPVFAQIPAIQDLKVALEELDMAKMEIEEMIEAYGKDEAIIAQIRDIELERTDVIKKLAAYLV